MRGTESGPVKLGELGLTDYGTVAIETEQAEEDFFDMVSSRWPRNIRQDLVWRTVQAVLYHLRKRLPASGEHLLVESLPHELYELSSSGEARNPTEEWDRGEDPVENSNVPTFISEILTESGHNNFTQAKAATMVVLASVVELLPSKAALMIRTQLPHDFKELWTDSLSQHKTSSQDLKRFLHEMQHHFKGDKTIDSMTIANNCIIALLHRLNMNGQKMVLPSLPEEIRIGSEHLQPHEGGVVKPIERISAHDVIAHIQEKTGLPNRVKAEHAVLGVMRAVKSALGEQAVTVCMHLPPDWRELWDRA